MTRIATWLSLVKFSHSVFALPFALIGAWLAGDGAPALSVGAVVVVFIVTVVLGLVDYALSQVTSYLIQ